MGNSSTHLPRDNETWKEKQIRHCFLSKLVCKNMREYADECQCVGELCAILLKCFQGINSLQELFTSWDFYSIIKKTVLIIFFIASILDSKEF